MRQLLLAREAGHVKRYHTARIVHPETVAEHTFNVLNIMLAMTKGCVGRAALVGALLHDMGEPMVGDIPSPVKRAMADETLDAIEKLEHEHVVAIHPYMRYELEEMIPEDAALISLADKLDGLMKCYEELRAGNKNMRRIGDRYVSYIYNMIDDMHGEPVIYATEVIALYQQELLK